MTDLIEALRRVLASTFCLYMKTHSAHWNVEGLLFPELHKLFGEQYTELFESIDVTAEHIRYLDAYAPCSASELVGLSLIGEQETPLPVAETLAMLVADHDTMIAVLTDAFHVAEEADAQGVADYLTSRIGAHSKHRWFLRATAKRA